MDRQERTLDVVKSLNLFQNNELERHLFLEKVCDYFDFIKNQELDDADYRFLIHLSSKAGVPHYYDILDKFSQDKTLLKDEENIKLDVISSLIFESTLYTDENSKLHLYQKEVLDLFKPNESNRYFLSASTSFGKTHLVYEIINKMQYNNIVLIFPSIALLSENLSKIKEGKIKLKKEFKIHTLSDAELKEDNNIFLFTPERYLSFLDKDKAIKIDFIFVDEVYKIDNSFIIDNESQENERDIAYRMSLFFGLTQNTNVDLFIAGPYIEVFESSNQNYNPSFDLFLNDFGIKKLLRNEYEIVKVNKYSAENINEQTTFDTLEVNLKGKKSKREKIQELLDRILLNKENAIIYCNTKSIAEQVAREYNRAEIKTEKFSDFIAHLENTFDKRWIVIQALKKGIGVHHGVVPKYIQKEIIDLFNDKDSELKILSATTTITEGVNTTAKNMIVYKSSKGSGKNGKPLLKFDAKNIAGRAGRFMEHYVGRVITLDNVFLEVIEKEGKPIEHKNYNKETEKNEVEYEMTNSEFLDDRIKAQIQELNELQHRLGIPQSVINQFKVISKRQKLKIYQQILSLSQTDISNIKRLIANLNSTTMRLDKDGFQVILDTLFPEIENETLRILVDKKYRDKFNGNEYSILFVYLNQYITNGYHSIYEHNLQKELTSKKITLQSGDTDLIAKCVDNAMRHSSELLYNTFKYQLVKYLGVFNLMFKVYVSTKENKPIEDVAGIDILLTKLEYNAFSERAKIASDYGVPNKIVAYYDANTAEQKRNIINSFDNYEKTIFEKVKTIIEQ